MTKNCIICNTAFESLIHNAAMCSIECRKKRNAARCNRWRIENPEKEWHVKYPEKHRKIARESARRYRKENPEKCLAYGRKRSAQISEALRFFKQMHPE